MNSFRFSRKILWLNLYPTNHDPGVISRHYLNCIEEVQGKKKFMQLHIAIYLLINDPGCPTVVRGDYGTENGIVAKVQIAFRKCANQSFFYGPSTANIVSRGN